VDRIINKYSDLFRLPDEPLDHTDITAHKIVTTDDRPISTKQYRFLPFHKDEINKQVEDLMKNEVTKRGRTLIKPSNSPYNSPIWVVSKKPDSQGNKRAICEEVIDFRALNEKTIGNAYPLPNITEILVQLGSTKYFSVFDLASGFHQIPIHESDAQKTAFSTSIINSLESIWIKKRTRHFPKTHLFRYYQDQVLSGLQRNGSFLIVRLS